jgi:hypothetical protein
VFVVQAAAMLATLLGNSANAYPVLGFGGALYNLNGDVDLLNDTFYKNSATYSAAVYNYSESESDTVNTPTTTATLQSRNSILASGYADSNIVDLDGASDGGFETITFDPATNIIENYEGQMGLDPMLDDSEYFYYAVPLTGSPAIDAGDTAAAMAAGLTTDQRGAARYMDGDHNGTAEVDIGSIEYGFAGLQQIPDQTIDENGYDYLTIQTIPSDIETS